MKKILPICVAFLAAGCADYQDKFTTPFSMDGAYSVKIGDTKSDVLKKIGRPYDQSISAENKVGMIWTYIDVVPNSTKMFSQISVAFNNDGDDKVDRIGITPPCQQQGGFDNRGINHCKVIITTSDGILETTILKSMYSNGL